MMTAPFLTASEIGVYACCPLPRQLRRRKVAQSTLAGQRLSSSTRAHVEIGRQTDALRGRRHISRRCWSSLSRCLSFYFSSRLVLSGAFMSILPLVAITVALLRARSWLGRSIHRREAPLGLEQQTIIAADNSPLGASTLRSARFRLVGRPDHLLRSYGFIIPAEQKRRSHDLHDSHVLQVAAQCLLVQEAYRRRPPYGIVVLAGGRQIRIAFTADLENAILRP